MGMADIAEVLWRRFLKHNPADPHWPDRDRFVLSNGHGSMLLYALLHLTGYDLPMEELKRFRQLHSKTPGHPEVGVTPGVETTTGPARSGIGQCGRHGAVRAVARGPFQPAGPHHRRSSHLGIRRRRLPDGGHQPRSLFAGRHARTFEADRDLRRQRHQHRRARRELVHRRYAEALRSLRLARHPRRRRPRHAGDRGGVEAGLQAGRPADAGLLQDHHRQGKPEQGRYARRARRRARRRRGRRDPQPRSAGRTLHSRSRRRFAPRGMRARAAPSARPSGASASPPTQRRTRILPRNSSGA